MSRHCVSIVLGDGMTVSMQFDHLPTQAEIEKVRANMNSDIELLKSQFKKPAAPKEEEYP